jgi:cold shock CspA family protein
MTGKILRVMGDKGFGFLLGADGTEYFFHRSAFKDNQDFNEVHVGDTVEFTPTTPAKGPRAEEVERK